MKAPKYLLKFITIFVNLWFRLLGDKKHDFYTTCYQFSQSYVAIFNKDNPDSEKVYYQS